MKKITVVAAILVIILASLALAGIAFAQTETPPNSEKPYGGGQFWGQGTGRPWPGRGMMGGRWNTTTPNQASRGYESPLHEYMISAMAEAFNLTPEEIENAILQARSEAISQAVADGVISQEQADWMSYRMNQMWSNGFGPGSGSCTGMGVYGAGRHGGWRWNK